MLAELRAKSQITVPKALVEELGLKQGDKVDFFVKDGMLCAIPVVVYPKAYVDHLNAVKQDMEEKLAKGEQRIYHSVEEVMAALEED